MRSGSRSDRSDPMGRFERRTPGALATSRQVGPQVRGGVEPLAPSLWLHPTPPLRGAPPRKSRANAHELKVCLRDEG